MAKQTIDIGSSPNKGDGDPLRVAFNKINQNFTELYDGNFVDPASINSSLIPQTTATVDLGSAENQWADLYVKDFIYLNGVRLEAANGNLFVEGTVITADSQGSVFGDDSTLLVDGVNNVINLNGTISTHIIPTTTEIYDLGSASNRFRDLYLSGSTIDLGGTTISTVGGELRFGGVKVPTVTDLAAGITVNPTGDLQGSVFADDSTLLVDGVAGKIRGDIENDTVDITSTVGDVNITAADDIDLTTTGSNGDIRLYSADAIRFSAVSGIDIFNTDNIYATVTNDIDFIADTGTARLYANGRLDLISETDQFNIEGVSGSISVETDLIIFTNAITENNPTGTNNNIQLLQNGNIVAEAFQGDIYNDSGDTKLLDASQEELLCDVAFTPDAAGGWDTFWADPKPQTVAEALDRLAQAIYTANGGTPV